MFVKKKNFTYLVAEIGWNFLGNLPLAKKMILAAKRNGADAVKFQMWNPRNLKKGPWDLDGRRKIYEKSFLDSKKYSEIFNFSKKNNIVCFASVWSKEDIKTLSKVSKNLVKIPSPESYNIELIEAALKTFKEVIISTGCLKLNELKKLLKYKNNKKLTILHCVSSYPIDSKNCNFKKFFYLKKNFKKVGYSGHFDGIEDAIFAMANNAVLIEKHFTTNNLLSGRDNKFALTPKKLLEMKKIRDLFLDFRISKGLDIQKNEFKIFKNYRGRWISKKN